MSEAIVGVDLGGTTIKAALVSPRLELQRRDSVDTPLESMPELLEAIEALVKRIGDGADVRAVGLGVPSQIDQRHGRIVDSVNVPLADVPFLDEMRRRLGRPVRIENDANAACLAEARMGAARGALHAIMITLGTGVGGGVLIDGDVYHGAKGAGGELGHVVIDEDGPPCKGHCPNRGCLEILCSATGLLAAYRTLVESGDLHDHVEQQRGVTELHARDVLDAAERDDPAACEALAIVGRHLGVGLSSFVNVFDPEVIVIGGGLSVAGERLIEPARAEMEKRALRFSKEGVRVVAAQLGNDAGMIGAAALVAAEAASA